MIRIKKITIIITIIVIISLLVIFLYVRKPSTSSSINVAFMTIADAPGVEWAIENNYVSLPENVDFKILENNIVNELAITGKADIALVSIEPFLQAWSTNKDWKIVYPARRVPLFISVRKDSNITTLGDLKGKTIGVGGLRLTTTILLLNVLEKGYNITPSEITLISKPLSIIPPLVEKKDVDAGIGTPGTLPSVEKLGLEVIADISEEYLKLYGDYPMIAVMAAKGTLDKNVVMQTADSLGNALEIAYENSDKVVEWYYKKHGVNLSSDFALWKKFEFGRLYTPWSEEMKKALQYEFEILKENGIVQEIPDNIEDVII